MKKKFKSIPKFKNEDQERDFWTVHDTTEYFDMDHPVKLDFFKKFVLTDWVQKERHAIAS